MTEAEIAAGLSEAQKRALYPGPGNPEYARGSASTMKTLERKGLVTQVSAMSFGSGRTGRLTPLGLAVRAILQEQGKP